MIRYTTYRPQSDQFDELVRGMPLANRVNDMIAKHTSDRYRDYLQLVSQQYAGQPVVDPNDQYREKVKTLIPRAIRAYEAKEGRPANAWRCYFHSLYQIAALPDAIEDPGLGITFHIRNSETAYRNALETGISPAMERTAQAMMIVCGMQMWLHVNIFPKFDEGACSINTDLISDFDRRHAQTLEEQMMAFLLKTRQSAQEAA